MLRPVNEPMPMNTSDPMPAARRPGSKMTGRIAPPNSRSLDDDHRANDRRTEQGGHCGEARSSGNSSKYLVRSAFPSRANGQNPEARRDCDQGCLSTRTIPNPIEASEASNTPGSSIG